MPEPGSDSFRVRGLGSGRSHPPGAALAPAPEVLAPIFGPPGSSLSGSQNITGVCKEWEGQTTDSLPSPQGGSGAVGRSRRQNTFRVPEAPEQRVRVSQPQPSPSPAPAPRVLPFSLASPSFGCSQQSPLIKQGACAVSVAQKPLGVRALEKEASPKGCLKTKVRACYLTGCGVEPGQVPCPGSMESHPGWEEVAWFWVGTELGKHRLKARAAWLQGPSCVPCHFPLSGPDCSLVC